jgi:virginiamycin B lyase
LWFTNIDSIGRLSRAGKFSEYPVSFVGKSPFGSGVEGITVGPNSALWFTEVHGNRLGCVTTAGTVTQFPVIPTAESNPFYLTEGPDGALWFTEENAGKVGRMTTTGSFTEFPLPDSQAKPMGITVGPDGALWFAESDQSDAKIGRLSFP